ncbi:hypothetical protein RRG08_030506 [Elysia crispata]|uniref:Uncharacterized protein n=1 Tax=Elysia crispata TaxID=231223 RepID=A0AAE1ALH8_9GAST|nr:hypothetical protein RRG08_030506 [Elysia crispata]
MHRACGEQQKPQTRDLSPLDLEDVIEQMFFTHSILQQYPDLWEGWKKKTFDIQIDGEAGPNIRYPDLKEGTAGPNIRYPDLWEGSIKYLISRFMGRLAQTSNIQIYGEAGPHIQNPDLWEG